MLHHKTSPAALAEVDSVTAAEQGLWRCRACGLLCEPPADAETLTCPRCHHSVTQRLPNSLSRCWAYLIAAAVLYIPANLLPVMVTSTLLDTQSDTIFSGIVFLWLSGSWALALLVFVASILVPLFKLLVLSFLLVSVKYGSRSSPLVRTKLYRILEAVGRWSMLDIYVVTWMTALVQIQSLATITPGAGAISFGAVVILTMLATLNFDPRLIWDTVNRADRVSHVERPAAPPVTDPNDPIPTP